MLVLPDNLYITSVFVSGTLRSNNIQGNKVNRITSVQYKSGPLMYK